MARADGASTRGTRQAPIKVLFIGVNPDDLAPLDLPKEADTIQARLDRAHHVDRFECIQRWRTQAGDLPGLLMRYGPQILHFSGHSTEDGRLYFRGPDGRAIPADEQTIAQVFRLLDGVRCVVLNACHSTEQAQLIARHVELVVGMNGAIDDEGAIAFAAGFYEGLNFGQDVQTAFELGCLQLELCEAQTTATPTLHAREGVDPRQVFVAQDPREEPSSKTREQVTNLGELTRAPHFNGREAELEQIHRSLTTPDASPVALVGLGGVGKTRLAFEYAHGHSDEYPVRWWVRAATTQSMEQDIVALGLALELAAPDAPPEQIRQRTLEWLGARDQWLMVFDNVSDPAALQPILGALGRGAVLVTSRARAWRVSATPIELDVLDPEHALALLVQRSGVSDDATGPSICQALGYLPLALVQAAAYIDAIGCSCTEYLEMLREVGLRVFESSNATPGDHYPSTVAKTWLLSMRRLAGESPSAAALLEFLSFLDPDGVSLDLLALEPRALPGALAECLSSTFARNEALAALLRYSLVEREADVVRVHRLVQAVTRDALDTDGRERASGQAFDWARAVFDYKPESTNIGEVPAGIAKQAVVVGSHRWCLATRGAGPVWLLADAAIFYSSAGYVRAANTIARMAVEAAEFLVDLAPDAHEYRFALCSALSRTAEIEQRGGDLHAARRTQLEALSIAHELVPHQAGEEMSRVLALMMTKYGELEELSGRRDHARSMYASARAILDNLGTEELDVVHGRHYGAVLCKNAGIEQEAGHPEDARATLLRCLGLLEQLDERSPDHPQLLDDLADVLGLLAQLEAGAPELARGRLQRALDIAERLVELDPGHVRRRRTLYSSLGRFAQFELRLGNLDAAELLFSRAHDVAEALARADPDDAQASFDLIHSHGSLVQVAVGRRDYDAFTAHVRVIRARHEAMAAQGLHRGFKLRETYLERLAELERELEETGHWTG